MTPDQMRDRSSQKVKQVMELMKVLNIHVEARQRVDSKSGFLENMIFWVDDERYAPAPTAVEATSPSSETGESHA